MANTTPQGSIQDLERQKFVQPGGVGTQTSVSVTSAGSSIPASIPANYVLYEVDNSAVNNQPLYLGYTIAGTATSAASWAIKKIGYDSNGNPTSFTWASVSSGLPASNLIWNSRAGYTYS